MTRQGLLHLLTAAPLAVLARPVAPARDTDRMLLRLGPGKYTIGAGGGICVSAASVQIEGCTFEGCTVGIADSSDAKGGALVSS